jgi:negative regulator of sigma E activity
MTSRHLYEMIDACRPGHDDINQPEFSELANAMSQDLDLQRLFARSQAVDSAMRTAFQAVIPPPGFANRLIEAIEAAATEESDETSIAVADSELQVELANRPSRRTFAIWTGVVSLSAVAATIVIWLTMSPPVTRLTDQSIAENVDQWNLELDKVANWQSAANLPAQDFPTWQHLKISDGDRWQWVSKRRVVCYDLLIKPREDGEIVRLFISQPTAAVSLPANPPAGYPSPRGWHVGAWQANGRVYYLAVYANPDGDRDSKSLYLSVIRPRIGTA